MVVVCLDDELWSIWMREIFWVYYCLVDGWWVFGGCWWNDYFGCDVVSEWGRTFWLFWFVLGTVWIFRFWEHSCGSVFRYYEFWVVLLVLYCRGLCVWDFCLIKLEWLILFCLLFCLMLSILFGFSKRLLVWCLLFLWYLVGWSCVGLCCCSSG